MPDLFSASLDIIKRNQAPNGAFPACPAFSQYQYSWLRDGVFIAYALDRTGEHAASRRFYRWVDAVIKGNQHRLTNLERKMKSSAVLAGEDFLPTRYRLDGTNTDDDWPNFQLDGYGIWLWGLAEHAALSGMPGLLGEFEESIGMTLNYLRLCWQLPNFDCWEEHGNQVHTATLCCLSGGLRRLSELTGDAAAAALAGQIKRHLLLYGVADGRLIKFCHPSIQPYQVRLRDVRVNSPGTVGESVDASLLWAAIPFGVVDPLDPAMLKTVQEIRLKLFKRGGMHRYPLDTYYGGGLWLLLSAWLGWYDCRIGNQAEAASILAWLERQADAKGFLPEQIKADLIDAGSYRPWVRRWGPIAKPLLWSHAMYLILRAELVALEQVRGEA